MAGCHLTPHLEEICLPQSLSFPGLLLLLFTAWPPMAANYYVSPPYQSPLIPVEYILMTEHALLTVTLLFIVVNLPVRHTISLLIFLILRKTWVRNTLQQSKLHIDSVRVAIINIWTPSIEFRSNWHLSLYFVDYRKKSTQIWQIVTT